MAVTMDQGLVRPWGGRKAGIMGEKFAQEERLFLQPLCVEIVGKEIAELVSKHGHATGL